MKTIHICAFFLLVMSVVSCKKDFLEKNPTDQLSSGTFWKTSADADMALTGVYSVMTDHPSYTFGRMLWDGLADIGFLKGPDPVAEGDINATSGSFVSSVYNNMYVGISRCNIFLANIDKVEMDAADKTRDKAEVYFIRAHSYFTLSEFYGGVPLYTTPVTIEESKVKQATKAEVVAQVLSDLDSAINGLPDESYSGHAVKGSALALKAKVLLHNEKWAESAAAANLIIQSGTFSLYNDYRTLFLTSGQDNNPEIIFSVKYLLPDNPTPTTNDMNPDLLGGHSHILSPIQRYVDMFECTDGQPISSSPLYNPANPFANRDPRLSFTVADSSQWSVYTAGKGETGESWTTNYIVEKYVNWDNAPYSWATRSDQDFIVLRYADVLLMYAEAQNEAVGPDASVYSAVNQVRARPTVNMPPLTPGLDQTTMRDAIRNERAFELGMEGFRYLDIKRWKTAEKILPTIIDPGGYQRKFDPSKNYLFPFQQSELDINPNLVQNPGY